MKNFRQIRLAAFGAAVLMLAGAAGAQTYDNAFTHGNSCTGGGVVPSAWGVYNPSFSSAANVTCPMVAEWPQGAGTQQRWVQITFWNRSTTPNAFHCTIYGLNDLGNVVWSPTVYMPTGYAGGPSGQISAGTPPLSAEYFSASCTIPLASGAGNVYSYLSGIALKVGS